MRHMVSGRASLDGLEAGHEATIARATTATVTDAAALLKESWRDQIRTARLGDRLANSVRTRTYPQGQDSVDAAALVWTKAPKIIGAYADGAVIRPLNGRKFLWLPTEEVPKKRQGNALTPQEVEARFGRQLTVVNPGDGLMGRSTTRKNNGVAFAGYRNLAIRKGTGRWRNASLNEIKPGHRSYKAVTGQFVVMFILVPLVRVTKRGALNPAALQAEVDAAYDGLLSKNWSGR